MFGEFCRGDYKVDVLHANSTRYPWALRTHSMSGASAEQALQQRYARICAYSQNGKPDAQRQTYPPMLLGLWDAVGVVHELNGYRHDVVAAMARYKDERALEFNAMEHIEQIDTLLQRNAAVLSDLPPPKDAACAEVFDDIEMFYNPQRRHGSTGNLSPVEFERRYAQRGS
ncbi:transposase [Xanthomonas oryzae pv. oryzae]|nr:transposase [Xanthomonas oryzae pv. oryzae]OLI15112.1 transposase [Xanthomonas oryzae pv. oryzae]OLI82108.1 transposase [Xanthomonas oryzae pv. oryzae]OLI99130.1 transposase [Xanthomonas oryzae pv. oryzae]PNR72339.1 transposase [Xanthomonas oryzae pv. oryzae]